MIGGGWSYIHSYFLITLNPLSSFPFTTSLNCTPSLPHFPWAWHLSQEATWISHFVPYLSASIATVHTVPSADTGTLGFLVRDVTFLPGFLCIFPGHRLWPCFCGTLQVTFHLWHLEIEFCCFPQWERRAIGFHFFLSFLIISSIHQFVLENLKYTILSSSSFSHALSLGRIEPLVFNPGVHLYQAAREILHHYLGYIHSSSISSILPLSPIYLPLNFKSFLLPSVSIANSTWIWVHLLGHG